jgi:hypothetical protein
MMRLYNFVIVVFGSSFLNFSLVGYFTEFPPNNAQ